MGTEKFGNRLSGERNRLGFTQAEAAKLGGVSLNTQFKYEKGVSSPDAEYLGKIAAAGFDVLHLLVGDSAVSSGGAAVYKKPGDALYVVLSVQESLGLTLSADQIKVLLEYAFTHRVNEEGVREFVTAAYKVAGKPLDEKEGVKNGK